MFGSSKSPTVTTKTYQETMTPKQKSYLDKAIDLYGSQLGKNNTTYLGNRVADFNPIQNKVFDFANNGGFITTPQQTADYFNSTVKTPTLKNLNETVLPAVKEAFSGPGYWGSGRANAEVKAATDTADKLNTAWGNLNWDTQQANKQGAKDMYQVGSTQQQQAQNQINADMARFAEQNQITDPESLNILMSLMGMNAVASGKNQEYATTPAWNTGNWLDFGLGGVSGVKSLLGGFFK